MSREALYFRLKRHQRFADARGYRVQRLRFNAPEQLSRIVASIYRDWYQRWLPQRSPERLIVESFFLFRYHRQLRKILRHRFPVPALPLSQLLEMIQRFAPGMLT